MNEAEKQRRRHRRERRNKYKSRRLADHGQGRPKFMGRMIAKGDGFAIEEDE